MSRIDDNFVNQIKALAESLASWNKNKAVLNPIIEKMEALGSEPFFNSGNLYATLTGNRDKLIAAIRILRTAGLKANTKPKEGSPEYSAWFNSADATTQVYFQFSSTVCKRVKTGTRTETVDVYEIQCGEEDVAADLEEPVETAPAQVDAEVKEPADDVPF